MHYSLLVTVGPEHPAAASALATTEAILRRGHQIDLVFLFLQGVRLAEPGNHPIHLQWQQRILQNQLTAVACSGSASRHGLLDANQPDQSRLADGFDIAGLGRWAEALMNSDRVLQFGGG